MNTKKQATLSALLDDCQASGRYVLRRREAIAALRSSAEAVKKAARRLALKRRLAAPRRGFLVIVPVEYREAGAPPASWFLDPLMEFHGRPYYLGLLSAAAIHGAAHEQPQECQVVTRGQLRPAVAGRTRIRFFTKRRVQRTPTVVVKTETGTMRVSTPEATALDLLRYPSGAGSLGSVATVLAELQEKMDPRRLVEAAVADGELPIAQRLGHLMDRVGASRLADALEVHLSKQRPRYIRLRPDRSAARAPRDERWHVLVNERVEAET